VFARHPKFILVALLVALLSLAPGLTPSVCAADGPKGGGDDGKKSGPPPSNGKGPTKRVRGRYIVKIAGHFAGTGEAHATANGIKISARVKDPDGREYTLSARSLNVVNDRFTGTGSLSGMDIEIDGRVDPQDKRGEEVLKKGRITFTLRAANGKHARGAGDQREPGA
jgi:hypothetical protein